MPRIPNLSSTLLIPIVAVILILTINLKTPSDVNHFEITDMYWEVCMTWGRVQDYNCLCMPCPWVRLWLAPFDPGDPSNIKEVLIIITMEGMEMGDRKVSPHNLHYVDVVNLFCCAITPSYNWRKRFVEFTKTNQTMCTSCNKPYCWSLKMPRTRDDGTAQGKYGLFDWCLFTLSLPIILCARYFRDQQ